MPSPESIPGATLKRWQQEQYRHDERNHYEIFTAKSREAIAHYGLHFCKYVGRLEQHGVKSSSAAHKTLIDCFLVALSAANRLNLNLEMQQFAQKRISLRSARRRLALAAATFADGAEKIDHLEPARALLERGCLAIVRWCLGMAQLYNLDLDTALQLRRAELAQRAFYAHAA